MEPTTNTKKHLMVALTIFAISFVGSIGFYVVIAHQKQQVSDLRLDVSMAGFEDVVTLKRAIRMFEAYETELDTLVVDKDDLFIFIDDIDRLAQQGGATVSIQTVLVEEVGNDGKKYKDGDLKPEQRSHGLLTLSMRLEGEWEAVMNFLLQIEAIPRKMDLHNLRLASVHDRETGIATWSALFNVVTVVE